ncbi:MAG: SagB/ThcOx family dehydrogenase [Vicinamibacterales bacterium]
MSRWLTLPVVAFLLLPAAGSRPAAAQQLQPIALPAPQKTGGMPLMQALDARHSSREFSPKPLPLQTLSNLLWAGFGVNRQDGRRTAPSAMNWQEIDIYVFLAEGVYVYQARENMLKPVVPGDLRSLTGTQAFTATAPLGLVYIGDMSRTSRASAEQVAIWSPSHAGFIAQNVYLFCASEGLNVVVRGLIDKQALADKLELRPEQKVWLAQTVGYPAGK